MRTVPLSEAKDKLSGLVETVVREHEIISITRHGHPSAVLMSQDDLDSLHDTLFWLSQPGIRDDVAEARESAATGETISIDDVRSRFAVPDQ